MPLLNLKIERHSLHDMDILPERSKLSKHHHLLVDVLREDLEGTVL